MRLPESFIKLLDCLGNPDDQRIKPLPERAIVYPPVGFLPWPVCGIGNGDDYGYYWPIGKELEEPIVALMSHDCSALIPIASSIESLARTGACRELKSLLATGAYPNDDEPEDEEEGRSDVLDVAEALKLDDRSPFLLVANADIELARNDLRAAESLYQRAIEILPEDTAAHYGMVVLNRRLRRPEEAIKWMLEAIRSPLCFRGASFWADTCLPNENLNRNGYRRKCLDWLQQARAEHLASVADDPLFLARHRLTFASGVAINDDYLVYDDVIEGYVQKGRMTEAIKLAMVYGELMTHETISFQERSGFSLGDHRQSLLRLFREANLASRAQFLEQS